MKNKTVTILSLFILFFLFFIPTRDTDFGWHYRCGEMIIKEAKTCRENTFTYLLPGYNWYSPAHGYQILVYFIYRLSGFFGMSIFYAATAALVFTAFLKSLKGWFFPWLVLFLFLTWFSWGVLGLGFRSQIISVYLFTIFLVLVDFAKSNARILWLTPLLTLIWVNSHPGFFLGLVILAAFNLECIFRFLKRSLSLKTLLTILAATAANLLATGVNPYGLRIYQEVFQHTKVPLNTLIAEWVGPLPWQSSFIIGSSLAVLALLFIRKSGDLTRILILIVAAGFALEARRNIPLFAIALIFALSENNLRKIFEAVSRKIFFWEVKIFLSITIPFIILSNNLPGILSMNESGYCQKALSPPPCQAVAFLKEQKPGRVYNTYEWGGFLIWKLPSYKFFVDGRMPSWDTSSEEDLPSVFRGKSPYSIYIETLQMQPGWIDILKNYKTDYIVIQPGTFLDLGLRDGAEKIGFRQIYNDGTAVIYQAKN